ncbi:MAG TPA: AAA family ATPase [Solirubrobacteraceae bacterium]|nr:AAA family ATPase [Solirubrobacteraceae bacterium]
MAEPPLDVGEFGSAFLDFMRAITEAAQRPESPLLARLREHLGVAPDELPVTAASFGIADRPNLQLALDAVLPERETIGLANPHMHNGGAGFAQLFARSGHGQGPFGLGPVEYADVEVGDGRVVRCVTSALLLVSLVDVPVAVVITAEQRPPMGAMGVRLEGISPDEQAVSRLFRAIREAMLEHNVFRGKLFSLSAMGSVIFPSLPAVGRDEVVLPDGTLERLEQHAIAIAAHADELRTAGRHLKRGVLLHGPPGTGKTLTVNYLLSAMEGRTAVILTGQALGLIEQAFAIARDLTPSTVVLEDVDLVAGVRTGPGSHGVLFELLNQLEGLAEDSDLLVLLTTNRPDLIEPALAARPGRVDLALELPLPDEDARRRLFRLYAQKIELDPDAERELVEHSPGATGAFIKELMRQATLRAAVNGSQPRAADVVEMLAEMLEDREALTRRLLGQPHDGAGPQTPPSPAMFRAIASTGLPMPPGSIEPQ